jgi:hypothetical protein
MRAVSRNAAAGSSAKRNAAPPSDVDEVVAAVQRERADDSSEVGPRYERKRIGVLREIVGVASRKVGRRARATFHLTDPPCSNMPA